MRARNLAKISRADVLTLSSKCRRAWLPLRGRLRQFLGSGGGGGERVPQERGRPEKWTREEGIDVRAGVPVFLHADQAGGAGAQRGAHGLEEEVQGARHPAVAAPQGEEPADAHRQRSGYLLISRSSTGIKSFQLLRFLCEN